MRRTILLVTALALSLGACAGAEPEDSPTAGTPATAAVEEAATEPGTDLDLGETATLVWQPTANLIGVLDVSVDAVAEQSRSVLDGWARDDVMAASRPYFVTVSLTNAGESDLGGLDIPLYLRDDTGALGAPWTLGGDFTDCQSGPMPTPFEPGDEIEVCLLYLAPDGARIEDMGFEPTEGYDPISWTGRVTEPDEPGRRPTRKADRKKRGNG